MMGDIANMGNTHMHRSAVDVTPAGNARWFRTRAGRHYGREIALLIVLKLVLLTLLWAVAVRPVPRADTSPVAVARHLGATQAPGHPSPP
jgi:hypothetical protein